MKLSEKIQEALREQQEINLSDPAVQKRLAAQWGYVPAGAQPAPIVPEGWKLVPIAPTDEMLRAHLAVDYPSTYKEFLRHPYNGEKTSAGTELDIAKASRRWASMLAAAPEAKR